MFAFQAQGIEQYPEGAVSEEQQWCKVVGGGLRTDQDDQVVCWTLKFVVLLLYATSHFTSKGWYGLLVGVKKYPQGNADTY
jgi:hypothetical protein